jgi:hypothetical protein
VTAEEWLAGFAERIGADPPTTEEVEAILALAGVAAHSSERIAAPVACWMIGRAGLDPVEAKRIATELE